MSDRAGVAPSSRSQLSAPPPPAPAHGSDKSAAAGKSPFRSCECTVLVRQNGQVPEQAGMGTSHNAEVWRVNWNATGSVLATAADDGSVSTWKMDYHGEWVCVTTASGESS